MIAESFVNGKAQESFARETIVLFKKAKGTVGWTVEDVTAVNDPHGSSDKCGAGVGQWGSRQAVHGFNGHPVHLSVGLAIMGV